MPQAAGSPGAAARSPGGATRRVVESLRGALPGTAQWGALWTRCCGRAGDGRILAEFCSHGAVCVLLDDFSDVVLWSVCEFELLGAPVP